MDKSSLKTLSSKKNISIIYALWIGLNYIYLQSYMQKISHTAYYGDFGSMSKDVFLLYIILTFSLVTFAYFIWVIWFNREHKDWSYNFIKNIIISTLILSIVIATPFWFKNIYEELPHWKFWDDGEWDGYDSNGAPTTISEHPALQKFGAVSLFSYVLCIISSLFIYIKESSIYIRESSIYIREPSIEINSHAVVKYICQMVLPYIVYGIVSHWLFLIVSTPCVVLLAMVRFRIIPYQTLRQLIMTLITIYVLATILIMRAGDISATGAGPVSFVFLVVFFGIYFNIWFYFAVFVGLISIWIKNIGKLKWKRPFFNGLFITGLISLPILCILWYGLLFLFLEDNFFV